MPIAPADHAVEAGIGGRLSWGHIGFRQHFARGRAGSLEQLCAIIFRHPGRGCCGWVSRRAARRILAGTVKEKGLGKTGADINANQIVFCHLLPSDSLFPIISLDII